MIWYTYVDFYFLGLGFGGIFEKCFYKLAKEASQNHMRHHNFKQNLRILLSMYVDIIISTILYRSSLSVQYSLPSSIPSSFLPTTFYTPSD